MYPRCSPLPGQGGLDRRPNDWELSEWLRFCYRREAYAEAVALFQHIQPDQVEPEQYKELKKIVSECPGCEIYSHGSTEGR